LSRTNLTKPEEGGEKVVCLEPSDHSVGGDGGGVHAKESKNNAYNEAKPKNGSQQDDNDHNVVAANICGDRNGDDGDKNNTGGHHGNGVEDAREEKGDPLAKCEVMFTLNLESSVLSHYERESTANTRKPKRGKGKAVNLCLHSFLSSLVYTQAFQSLQQVQDDHISTELKAELRKGGSDSLT